MTSAGSAALARLMRASFFSEDDPPGGAGLFSAVSSDSSSEDSDGLLARPPAPALAPAPAPPEIPPRARAPAAATTPRTRPAPAAVRPVPCAGCLASALAGRSDGECRDAERGSRCWRCASGHQCVPIPAHVLPFAQRFLVALQANPASAEVKNLRAATRVALEIPAAEFAVAAGAPVAGAVAARAGAGASTRSASAADARTPSRAARARAIAAQMTALEDELNQLGSV
ncbi:hypothetical protein HD806DRAFT_532087 [Xylariaceae sp. AK1471]|nr:hypothetical protein HD806DRAFT_532087 [Xylariaceae sp. AK1471]